jgi:DNA-binding NtrC family response regulator
MPSLRGKEAQRERVLPPLSLRHCKLSVLKGPSRGVEHVLSGDVIRVGKANENDLVLADETVSRFHFEIVRDVRGYLLRDLRSTNGTFVDGAEIREAYIRAGAVIAAGAVQIRFVPAEERVEIAPSEREELGALVGRCGRMRYLFALIERVAVTDLPVLIEGEAGTGKSLIASTMHELSTRRTGPLITVDCGAVAGTLIESELFGHERGAFSGATHARPGAFERAQGGTLVLDNVGKLAVDLQPKLLSVVERREVRRIGGARTTRVNARVVSIAQDLRSEIEQGKFLSELYFRLDVVPVAVPSLRERPEDVPLLLQHFACQLGADPAQVVSVELASALSAHDWPGNVRELRSFVARALAPQGGTAMALATRASEGERLEVTTLAGGLAAGTSPGHAPPDAALDALFEPGRSFRQHKEHWNELFERRYLVWLLRRAGGNISKAARDADMDRKYLHKLLKKYDIDPGNV